MKKSERQVEVLLESLIECANISKVIESLPRGYISMKKKIVIKIKPEDLHLRNELHFEVQKTTRAHVFKPKKGKGSFKRNKKVNIDE